MKINYKLANGKIVEVEVTEEQAAVIAEVNRKSESNDKKFRRRGLKETSLDYLYDEFGWEPTDDNTDVQCEVEQDDEAEYVRRAIAGLGERHQKIVRLHFYEGKTEREIASVLGGDGAGVHRQIQTALKKLRDILKK